MSEAFTFKPKINDIPRELYNTPKTQLDISKEEQWERILRPKQDDIEKREKLKQDKETQEVINRMRGITF